MATTNLDHHDLSAAVYQGLVREEVMERIWLIDQFPLPFTDCCSRDTTGNRYFEWTVDELGAPAAPGTNKKIDGQDMTDNDESIGTREGNQCQISTKQVNVSHRANQSNSVGRAGTLTYQIMRAQQRLRRDVEATLISDVASVIGTDAVAGVSAGYFAWVKTNTIFGATGADGGFDGAGIVDAPTFGTKAALTETQIRDVAEMVYKEGGMTTKIMSIPDVIRSLSEYLFTSSARVATQTNYNQGENRDKSSTAYGAHTVFVTDFGQVLEMVPNRLQPASSGATDEAHMAFIDERYLRIAFLQGYQTRPLARTGLSEKRMVSVDFTLAVTNEKSQGAIRDIDTAAAVTA